MFLLFVPVADEDGGRHGACPRGQHLDKVSVIARDGRDDERLVLACGVRTHNSQAKAWGGSGRLTFEDTMTVYVVWFVPDLI
jgi:hypothetical protein